MALSFQEDTNAPIAIPWVLQREPLHRCNRRRITFCANRAICQHGAGNADQLASLALGMPAHPREGNLLAPGVRAHHFRRLISFRVSIAISRSASMRLSLAFSDSKARKRLTSAGSSAPNFCRQV